MAERRWNSRIQVNIPCSVMTDRDDAVGIIRDMSEEGLGIIIDKDLSLHVGQSISVAVNDSYTFFNKDKLMFFTETVTIKDIIRINGNIRIGCKVLSRGFQQLVSEIKADIYAKQIEKIP